jgi:hypothetical protein
MAVAVLLTVGTTGVVNRCLALDSLNMQLVASLPEGPCQEVAAGDSTIFFTNGRRIEVAVLNDEGVYVRSGYVDLPTSIADILVTDEYLYVACGGLGIVDISDLNQPELVSFYPVLEFSQTTYDYARYPVIYDNYVYMLVQNDLHIFDVSRPSDPRHVGIIRDISACRGLAVRESRLYILQDVLLIYDLDNPSSPQLIRADEIPRDYNMGIAITGDYALLSGDGLCILDISSPDTTVFVSELFLRWKDFNMVCASDSFVYLSSYEATVVIWLSDPADPNWLLEVEIPKPASDFTVIGSHLVYALGNYGCWIYDLSDIWHPNLMQVIQTWGGVSDIQFTGNTIFIAYYNGLRIIDLIDGEWGAESQFMMYSDEAQHYFRPMLSLAINGNYVLLGTAYELIILDVSDRDDLREIARMDWGYDSVRDIVINGQYAFVALGRNGLKVIDISDIDNPAEIGSLEINSSSSTKLDIHEDLLFWADQDSGLSIIDITDPQSPAIISNYRDRFVKLNDVQGLDAERIATASLDGIVSIYDISDPRTPRQLGFYQTDHPAPFISNAEDLAFLNENCVVVAYGGSGVEIVNFTDPGEPYAVGYYLTGGYTVTVAVQEDIVVGGDWGSGVTVFQNLYRSGIRPRSGDSTITLAGLQSFPNPFNESTTVHYSLSKPTQVDIRLFDITGRIVFSMNEGWRIPGTYRFQVSLPDCASGKYLLVFTENGRSFVRDMNIIR